VELLAFEGRASHVSGWLAGYGLVLPRSPRIRELSREGAQRRPRGQKQPCTRTGLDSLENDFFFFFETCVDKGAGSSEKVCSAAAGASYVLIRVSPPLKFFHKPRISCVCVPHPTLLTPFAGLWVVRPCVMTTAPTCLSALCRARLIPHPHHPPLTTHIAPASFLPSSCRFTDVLISERENVRR
jgi:hypothetical protein